MTPTQPHRLQVDELCVGDAQGSPLLDQISFSAAAGERVAVVGASGAGKSMLAHALLQTLRPPLRILTGQARLDGQALFDASPTILQSLRGRGLFLVFQSPGQLLDPVLRIGTQLSQVAQRARAGDNAGPADVRQALAAVGLSAAVLQQHALELSGGMKQRVLIAMALLLRPRVLVADEPTSGLDDETAEGVLQALAAAQRAIGSTLLLVTHDLRLVERHCDRVLVLDTGRLVEDNSVGAFMRSPRSPAGRALRDAALELSGSAGEMS